IIIWVVRTTASGSQVRVGVAVTEVELMDGSPSRQASYDGRGSGGALRVFARKEPEISSAF
ncbi:MAG: hypothetical protein M3144_00955, partial [Actinomycetota bacterium]|nr:hypothetical protein [Actinomycetota bacterium]